jgi:hypothetical protein
MTRLPPMLAFAFAAALLFSTAVLAQVEDGAMVPPVAGQPADFSQIVGSYSISVQASRTALNVEDPLILTVRIIGTGPQAYWPQREHLRLFPASVAKDFYIKALPDRDRFEMMDSTWEFAYELRPRHAYVIKIPALRLVYYDPSFKAYQTAYAPAVPLTVKPRPQAKPPEELAVPVQGPAGVYELTTGPEVLSRQGTGWPLFLVLGLGPPVLCGLWYVLWRRRYPGAARLARQRRSRAAEQAIQGLAALKGEGASQVAGLVARYLRQRLDLPAAEPTPREAARHLRRLGVSPGLVRQTATLLRACDADRFAPGASATDTALASEATGLILALEAEPCHF